MTTEALAPSARPVKLLVTRSDVTLGLPYREYHDELRHDFFYSCAYCTMAETEASTIGFTIDHYEPKIARPDLQDSYDNLMYACAICNTFKGDRCPPEDARKAGYRFYRADEDAFDDHFELSGIRLNGKSVCGDFTIDMVELNRQSLRRLRDIRTRLYACHEAVAAGLAGLRSFRLDQLPPNVRGKAIEVTKDAERTQAAIEEDIDRHLREAARSPLADKDPDSIARSSERAAIMKGLRALFPGAWRGRDK